MNANSTGGRRTKGTLMLPQTPAPRRESALAEDLDRGNGSGLFGGVAWECSYALREFPAAQDSQQSLDRRRLNARGARGEVIALACEEDKGKAVFRGRGAQTNARVRRARSHRCRHRGVREFLAAVANDRRRTDAFRDRDPIKKHSRPGPSLAIDETQAFTRDIPHAAHTRRIAT